MNKLTSLLLISLVISLAAIGAAAAEARDIPLPPQTVKACVGKATRIVRSPVQLNRVWINGRTSSSSTFTVRTELARYTGDVDTADVVAFCTRAGSETISVMVELNNPDRTRYHAKVQVNCVPCD